MVLTWVYFMLVLDIFSFFIVEGAKYFFWRNSTYQGNASALRASRGVHNKVSYCVILFSFYHHSSKNSITNCDLFTRGKESTNKTYIFLELSKQEERGSS